MHSVCTKLPAPTSPQCATRSISGTLGSGHASRQMSERARSRVGLSAGDGHDGGRRPIGHHAATDQSLQGSTPRPACESPGRASSVRCARVRAPEPAATPEDACRNAVGSLPQDDQRLPGGLIVKAWTAASGGITFEPDGPVQNPDGRLPVIAADRNELFKDARLDRPGTGHVRRRSARTNSLLVGPDSVRDMAASSSYHHR